MSLPKVMGGDRAGRDDWLLSHEALISEGGIYGRWNDATAMSSGSGKL